MAVPLRVLAASLFKCPSSSLANHFADPWLRPLEGLAEFRQIRNHCVGNGAFDLVGRHPISNVFVTASGGFSNPSAIAARP